LGERGPRIRTQERPSAPEGRRKNDDEPDAARPGLSRGSPAPLQGETSMGRPIRGRRSKTRLPPAIFLGPCGASTWFDNVSARKGLTRTGGRRGLGRGGPSLSGSWVARASKIRT